MRFYLYLFFILNITSLSCQDIIESYDITLNIKNIKTKGSLFIAIWTDSNAFNSNKSDSSESKMDLNMDLKKMLTKNILIKQLNYQKENI